jgi:imidazole glycerol-phosphate synthase subunit HisF
MLKKRIIPVLLLKDGWIVQSKSFNKYQNIGSPINSVKRLSEWGSDELILLDISKENNYDLRRDDQGYKNSSSYLELMEEVSKVTFMPITLGGKIRTLNHIEDRLKVGADKVAINTKAIEDLRFIYKSAIEFGSQCIVVSLDFKKEGNEYFIYTQGGQNKINKPYKEVIQKIIDNGCGELFINSIDRDGTGMGFDMELINAIENIASIPVIVCGGAGDWEDFAETLDRSNVSAVSAANIFHFKDQSVYILKKFLYDNQYNIRKPELININIYD